MNESGAPFLELQGLSVYQDEKKLLDNINLKFYSGERVVISGRSGAGKTSLFSTILGLHEPQQGQILFHGAPLHPGNVRKLRQSIGFVGQEPDLVSPKIKEALLLPYTLKAHKHKQPDMRKILALMKQLDLAEELLEKETALVSGGEKQRLALLRELLLDKHFFLLDEISSALDRESSLKVQKLLWQNGCTSLCVSHDPLWIESSSRLIIMEDGKIISDEARNENH